MKCLSMIKEQYKSDLRIGISEYCFANVAKFISDYKNIRYMNKQIKRLSFIRQIIFFKCIFILYNTQR